MWINETHGVSEMSEKSSGVNDVRREIAVVAGPREWGDTRESWLAKASRRVPSVSFRTMKALCMARFRMQIIGPLATLSGPQRLSKDSKRRAPLRPNMNQSRGGCVQRMRIFIGMRLLRLSARLAFFAVWMAPEIKGEVRK